MPTYAFVDGIDESPNILLDLNDKSPFGVIAAGTNTSPPPKRFSSSGSTSRDGDNIAQSSYADRSLTIPLRIEEGSTAEMQVEAIQKLGRLLDQPQWLMWQHDGQIEPVFFRTRRGDYQVDEDTATANRTRRMVTISVMAEFAAYGLPVTNTVTIANDPTAATNPMSVVLPEIQGDVATPLSLQVTNDSEPLWWSLYNTVAGPSALVAPLVGSRINSDASGSGWTVTPAASDTAAIGGTATTLVKASGTSPSPSVTMRVTGATTGDYRMLVRVKAGAGGSLTYGSVTKTLYADNQYWWVDFGIVRNGRVPTSTQPPALSTTPAVDFDARFTGSFTSTGTIALNRIVLVPADVDGDVLTRMLMTSYSGEAGAVATFIDSISEIASVNHYQALTVAGAGFPRVVPGQPNRLMVVARTSPTVAYDIGNEFEYDDKATSTVLTYLYYPRYLYTRPASS